MSSGLWPLGLGRSGGSCEAGLGGGVDFLRSGISEARCGAPDYGGRCEPPARAGGLVDTEIALDACVIEDHFRFKGLLVDEDRNEGVPDGLWRPW